MIRFEINEQAGRIKLKPVLKKLSKVIFYEFKKPGVISIAAVSSREIKKINKTYRRKDKATDILTFVFSGGGLLGEIILSPKDAARRAKLAGKTLKETCAFLIIHGILHIMGYTHNKNLDTAKMENREKYLLKKIGRIPK